MTNGVPHTDQHWIPQSYLRPWADPTLSNQGPRVWRFSKDGQRKAKKSPKGIFYEEDMYTVHLQDGSRNLAVEHGLAGLENEFARIRSSVLEKGQTPRPDDSLIIRAFIAAMQARTKPHLDHWQGQWKAVQDMGERLRDAVMSKQGLEREKFIRSIGPTVSSGPSFGLDEVKQLAEGPVGPMVVQMIQAQLPTLAAMNLAVLIADDPIGFITSDRPCVWFDPEAYKLPPLFRSAALGSPTTEVRLPASPRMMLVLSWHELKGYYRPPVKLVDDMNRITRYVCHEYFIVGRDETKPVWFEIKEPPNVSESA